MTSAAVTERSGSIMNLAVQNTAVRTDGSEKGFTKVMDSVSENRNQETVTRTEKKSFSENDKEQTTNRVDDAKNESVNDQAAADKVKEGSETEDSKATATEKEKVEENPSDQDEEAVEAGEEAVSTQVYQSLIEQAANLMEQVADCLSVGTEDVMEAMKQLNMSMTDILNPEKMQELTLALAGADRMALLTDENLYQVVQELTQLSADAAKNLQEMLGISKEAWNGVLEKAAMEGMSQMVQGTEGENVNVSVENVAAEDVPEMQGMNGTETGMTGKSGSQNGQTDMEASVQKGNQQMVTGEAEEASRGMQEDTYAQGGEPNFAQNMQNPVNELAQATMKDGFGAGSKVDVEQIMKQIMDFMKIRNSEQLSEIEMQLHPASLGTVHISIAAKNGVVTAQFAAQNEVVKEAIEGQVMILRENLEQQGIKVEAVEVTVASHEFERNLDQEAKKEEREAEDAEERKKQTRRINLGSLEEGEEIQDEAERITRDMMMRHGTTLDYMA